MTAQVHEVVVTVVDGEAGRPTFSFKSGEARAPLSVGSRGEWAVSAPGVVDIHLWLLFDGQRLYAAFGGTGPLPSLQGIPLSKAWSEVPDRAELRFGGVRLRALHRSLAASAPVAPTRDELELSPIERAAALPLPSFFRDRLSGARSARASPTERGPRPAQQLAGIAPRHASNEATRLSKRRAARTTSFALLLPAAVLPLLGLGVLWLVISGRPARRVEADRAPSAATSVTLAPALAPPPPVLAPAPVPTFVPPTTATDLEPVREPDPLHQAHLPALDVSAIARPAVTEIPGPTLLIPPPALRAFPQNITDKPVPRVGDDPGVISEAWLSQHDRQLQAPNRGRAKVIFLGDSITEGWGMAAAYRDNFGKYSPLNLGIAGDVTQNVLWRIDHRALAGTAPELVVVMIGVNNLAGGFSAEATAAGIKAIVAAVMVHLPRSRVLLLAVLPARQDPKDPLRQRIAACNQLLAGLAVPGKVNVRDVGSVLLEADGTLSKSTMRDFVHPSAAGYERLSQAVAPLVDELVGPKTE